MAERRRGLGRGIGALIPDSQRESKDRPIDVFFGAQPTKTQSGVLEEGDASSSSPKTTVLERGPVVKPEPKGLKSKKPATKPDGTEGTGTSTSVNELPATTEILRSEGTTNDSQPVTPDGENGESASPAEADGLVAVPGATYAELEISAIVPNQRQPRSVFDEDELEELAASIKEVGVLQPVIVRPLTEPIAGHPDVAYELIMGERRWRASEKAGEKTIPAIVRRTADEDLLRDALLENLHRAELNPLEEAAAYQQLLEDFHCTQDELAKKIARSRPQITNTLRLMKLPPLVQRRVAARVLSAGHARALLGLSDPAGMERLAQRIVAEGLSVRQVEEIVAIGEETDAPVPQRRRPQRYTPELSELSGELADRFDTKVKVNMGLRKGSIKIDFGSIEDLNRILAVMAPEVNTVNVEAVTE